MRTDFCIFILTHGRAGRVKTVNTLQRCGYTGKLYIVIDDEDSQADAYRDEFGDQVLMFSKSDIATRFDEGDNFSDRRTITYARNACFELAEKVGCQYFMQLDDDYTQFNYRFDHRLRYTHKSIKDMDAVLETMLEFYEKSPFVSVAFAQGGDFIGGDESNLANAVKTRRKAMNSFICDTSKPFKFRGRFNEDVNTYTSIQRAGQAFLTILGVWLCQLETQSNDGGITELYKSFGTYVKSFCTVMYAPSCAVVKDLRGTSGVRRIHHQINWNNAAPLIIREHHKKA